MTNVSMFIDPATGLIRSRDLGLDNEVLNVATLESIDGSLPEDMEIALENFMRNTRITYGLWVRYPGATDNSVDNYIGIACLSVGAAKDIFSYGEKAGWEFWFPAVQWSWAHFTDYFKNAGRFFFGRFVGFKSFIKARAQGEINWIDALIFSASAVITSLTPEANTSDKCLQVLMNQKMRKLHWVSDVGIAIFEAVMNAKYPAGRKTLYGIYFGVSHPFTLSADSQWP